jgi:uncharacterized protein with NRDE domain
MCLMTFDWRPGTATPLLLAGNRDEFHARPAAAADWWQEAPQVFGGRDLSQGGGWLAVSTRNRLAAVTNVRRMVPPDPAAPSRGALVADFLRVDADAATFAERLRAQAARYSGFNLLLYDGAALLHVTNQPHFSAQAVAPGVHGLSNATLDTPWPKLMRVTQGLSNWLARAPQEPDALFDLLADPAPADDAALPDTGVGLEMERLLSSPFILSPHYGTRCSSIVAFSADGPRQFLERRYAPDGTVSGDTRQTF